jgi:GGDEF domain-containing protein/tetratricopeptide (TPR) repeat protein
MTDKFRHLERAEKHLRKGRMDAALEELVTAVDADPNDLAVRQKAVDLALTVGRGTEAARLLGGMFDQQLAAGDKLQAVATYRKLAKLAPPGPERAFAFARLLEGSSRSEALEAYEIALAGFAERRRPVQAMEAMAALVRLAPTAENYRRQGELAFGTGERDLAAYAFFRAAQLQEAASADPRDSLQRAHELSPDDTRVALALARAQVAHKSFDQALNTLEPLLARSSTTDDLRPARGVYGEALLGAGHILESEPYIAEMIALDPERIETGYELLDRLFATELLPEAVAFSRKLEREASRAGQRREFIHRLKTASEHAKPSVPLLQYMAEVLNSYSESDYCATLLKLFELHYAAGHYPKAAECLDRAAEVDAYEPGHEQRLSMLKGKVEPKLYNAIAARLGASPVTGGNEQPAELASQDGENTLLEDLILQAEIFTQYGMRPRALERLERIQKLFPGEEAKNEKLLQLYVTAGMKVSAPPPPPTPVAPSAPDTPHINDLARITDITRNVYRQGNVKSVLFTAVNEIGRHWQASRCIAVLATPGKPPSIAMEYVAPGLQQSDVMHVVKMVALIQPLTLGYGPLIVGGDDSTLDAPMRARMSPLKRFIEGIGIRSMLVVPLIEGEEHVGLLLLGQVDTPRQWGSNDVAVLKTIAEQVTLAVTNAKLRSLVRNLAVTEEASGLLKRASYVDMLLSEVRRSTAQKSMLTVMLLQFGRPGEMLKHYGEAGVETLMRDAGQLITSHIRQHDVALRYDKTTIALVLAETNERNGSLVATKLRGVMQAARLPGSDDPPPLTIGFAEAVLTAGYDAVDVVTEVINRAEAALDGAIKHGPDGVECLAPMAVSA